MLPPDDQAQRELEAAEAERVDDESSPASFEEHVEQRERRRAESTAQRTWGAAVGLLGLATVLAVVLIASSVVPTIAGGVADVGSGIGGAVGGSVSAVADSWSGWTSELEDLAAEQTGPGATLPIAAGSDSALLVLTNPSTRGVGFAVAARAPDGTGTLVLFPPALLAIMPGFGDFPLADSTLFEGPDLARLTISNLTGIRIDDVVHLQPGDVASALSGEVTVDLPVPLIVAEGQGDTARVLAASGKAPRPASAVETILVTKGESEDPEWLQRQGAAWDGILDAIADEPIIAARIAAFATTDSGRVEALLQAIADDERVITAIPVSRMAIVGSDAAFTIDNDDAPQFITQRLGHLLIREGERPRIELLNGNGRIGTTRVVAGELVRVGFRVIKTDNAESFDFEVTQVVAQGRDNRAAAQQVIDILTTGELLLEVRAPSGVVDVSIIVGQDIPAGEG